MKLAIKIIIHSYSAFPLFLQTWIRTETIIRSYSRYNKTSSDFPLPAQAYRRLLAPET